MVYFLRVFRKKSLVAGGLLAASSYGILWCALAAHWAWLEVADSWLLGRFHDYGATHPGWIGLWAGVSDLFGPAVLRVIAAIGVAVALIRRKVRVAVFLVLTLGAMGLVTVTAKALSDRPRPDSALRYESSTAFPSGHALGITVGVSAILTVLWPRLTPSMRRAALAVGAALILLVGFARVALNVHHPSDVVAGWALGFLYYLLCLAVVRPGLSGDRVRGQESDAAAPD